MALHVRAQLWLLLLLLLMLLLVEQHVLKLLLVCGASHGEWARVTKRVVLMQRIFIHVLGWVRVERKLKGRGLILGKHEWVSLLL